MIRIVEDAHGENPRPLRTSIVLTSQPPQDQSASPTAFKRLNSVRTLSLSKVNTRSATLKSRPTQDSAINRAGSVVLPEIKRDESPAQGRKSVGRRVPVGVETKIFKVEDEPKSASGRAYSEVFLNFHMEARRIIEEEAKKKAANSDIESVLSKQFLAENHEAVVSNNNSRDDAENVKTLDRWRMEIKREKLMKSMNKMSEIMDTYKDKKAKEKVKESINVPLVNAEALDRILFESDDEGGNGQDSDDENNFIKKRRAVEERDAAPKPAFGSPEKVVKGVETSMSDNNQDILQTLINKKMKENIKSFNLELMTSTQLRLQIKAIIDSAVAGFKALRGNISDVFINNQIEIIFKKLRSKKPEVKPEDLFSQKVAQHETLGNNNNKGPVDYIMIESALVKNYEQSSEEIQNRSTQINQYNHEHFVLKREMTGHQEQLQQLSKKTNNQSEKNQGRVVVPISMSDKQGKIDESSKDLNESGNDLIKNQKVKHEKKKQEALLREKIALIQQKLVPITRDAENAERELKSARNTKAYLKLQLKDLYLKIMKDEQYLMQSRSNASYTWIIRALWKINEEIKDQYFPTFMNEWAIKFLMEFAQAQNDLERFCRDHNLFGMISNHDDFKRVNVATAAQSPIKECPENEEVSNIFPEGTKPKSVNSLLQEMKDKMLAMKKSNLRAKKLVSSVHYSVKGRQMVTKWEDVNPFSTNGEYTNQSLNERIPTEEGPSGILKHKQSRVDLNTINEIDINSETVKRMLENIENMKRTELQRVIKENISVAFDQQQSLAMQKCLIFLFGNTGGNDYFRKLMKEKRVLHQLSTSSNSPIRFLKTKI